MYFMRIPALVSFVLPSQPPASININENEIKMTIDENSQKRQKTSHVRVT